MCVCGGGGGGLGPDPLFFLWFRASQGQFNRTEPLYDLTQLKGYTEVSGSLHVTTTNFGVKLCLFCG